MRIVKIIGIVLIALLAVGVATCSFLSKPVPEGNPGSDAEVLANNMLNSLNKAAWDSTRFVSWSFRGEHHYKWDKKANLAEISWDNNRVLLNPDMVSGVAYSEGQKMEDGDKLVQKAWSYWCNDMFWLVAPYKIKDEGTFLSTTTDGRLKVSYESGGVTPGDVYVWELDDTNKPKSYEMYVSIIPVKGLTATWENWQTISTGALIASSHEIAGSKLELSPIAGGMNLSDIGLEADIWAEIRD